MWRRRRQARSPAARFALSLPLAAAAAAGQLAERPPLPDADFWLWHSAHNRRNNRNNRAESCIFVTIWALSTAMEASLKFHKLVVTPRMRVLRNAVHRTSLQGPQSCSAKTHNAYNRKHNAYNRARMLHQAAFYSVCAPSIRCRHAGILHRHQSVIPS